MPRRHQRPRLPHETFRFDEQYGAPDLRPAIRAYDETMVAHWQKVGRSNGEPWTRGIVGYSNHNYRERLMPALLQQGFRFDKDPVAE